MPGLGPGDVCSIRTIPTMVMLRTSVVVRNTIIDYFYEPRTGTHYVDVWGNGNAGRFYGGTAGEMANVIAPYRGNAEVDELFEWLCR